MNAQQREQDQSAQQTQGIRHRREVGRKATRGEGSVVAVLAVLILFAPLLRGGYAPMATLTLQTLGVILMLLTLWRPCLPSLRWTEVVFLGLLLLLPMLYLLPVPPWLEVWLPGRDLYVQAKSLVGQEPTVIERLSIVPYATELSWLMLLIPIGVYFAMRTLSEQRQTQVVSVFFAIVLVQVLIALFQFGTANGTDYALANLLDRSGASGTYVNRNHLAGMIELALPVVLALFLYDFGGRFKSSRRRRGLKARVVAVLKSGNRPSVILVLLALLFIVGMIVTRSRTGIAMAMLGILLTTILLSRRVGGNGTFGLMGQLITISLGVALFLGLAPVLDRFAVDALDSDARWPIAVASFDAAGLLLPFGSGPGTYPDVFVLYQPIELGRWFINYAHNDYLQTFFEMGLPGMALIGLFLIFYLAQWPRLVTAGEWSRYRVLQIGAGIALLLLLGHSLTDNNLRNPANMAYFALLAAVFFSPPGMPKLTDSPRKRKRRTVTLEKSGLVPGNPVSVSADSPSAVQDLGVAPSRARNPFDD